MAGGIRKIAKKTLRELRGWGSNNKKSWWCNESMQNKVKGSKVKKVCYKP